MSAVELDGGGSHCELLFLRFCYREVEQGTPIEKLGEEGRKKVRKAFAKRRGALINYSVPARILFFFFFFFLSFFLFGPAISTWDKCNLM
jgi:hypothetical protein